MKLNPTQFRQGDVMLVKVDKITFATTEAKRDADGRHVIEHGEASGHAHALRDSEVTCFRAETAEMAAHAGLDAVFVGGSGALLRHEYIDGRHAEHEEIALPSGTYERAVQVEYNPEEERRLAD